MKIYQGQEGQFGDQLISLRVSEELRKLYSDVEIVSGVSAKYNALLPVLKTAPYVSRWIEWEDRCEKFPSNSDKMLIEREQFNFFYHPSQPSTPNFWQTHHQVADAFVRHGLTPPCDLKITLPPFINKRNPQDVNPVVCLSLLPNNGVGIKSLSKGKINSIIGYLRQKYNAIIVQLDGYAGQFNEVIKTKDWRETAVYLSCCNLLMTGDTASSWLGSAYDTPTIGCYAYGYYAGASTSKMWQPINSQAVYLEDHAADTISLDLIISEIDKKLN